MISFRMKSLLRFFFSIFMSQVLWVECQCFSKFHSWLFPLRPQTKKPHSFPLAGNQRLLYSRVSGWRSNAQLHSSRGTQSPASLFYPGLPWNSSIVSQKTPRPVRRFKTVALPVAVRYPHCRCKGVCELSSVKNRTSQSSPSLEVRTITRVNSHHHV